LAGAHGAAPVRSTNLANGLAAKVTRNGAASGDISDFKPCLPSGGPAPAIRPSHGFGAPDHATHRPPPPNLPGLRAVRQGSPSRPAPARSRSPAPVQSAGRRG